jgi:hypothetical protein
MLIGFVLVPFSTLGFLHLEDFSSSIGLVIVSLLIDASFLVSYSNLFLATSYHSLAS